MSNGQSSNLCHHPRKHGLVNQLMTIAVLSTAFSLFHRTGEEWLDIPEPYGKHSTISSRFYRWRTTGIWQQILSSLMQQADAAGEIDWEVHFVDGTIVRAHQHAAGALVGNPEAQALGRSVGGLGTKVHVKALCFGKPMNFVLTGGERHEAVAFPELVKGGFVKRQGRGCPKYRSRYLAGDKAYSSQEIRQQLYPKGTTPIIPKRSNEKRQGRFNRGLYRESNRVQRLINRLKQYRRIATRYEKYAVNYLAMLIIGAIRLWL